MTTCRKCGLPIRFKWKDEKWHPTNPDGSDHWDDCKTVERQRSGLILADGSLDWERIEREHPTVTTHPPTGTVLYEGAEPPWD